MTTMLRKYLAASAVLLCSIGHVQAQEKTIVVNSFGGDYEKFHRTCVIAPFEKKTGTKVRVVTLYSVDLLAQLRAQKASPQWDVALFSGGQEIVAAAEGLILPIDPKTIPNVADVYDFAKANLDKGQGPAYSLISYGLIYNNKRMTTAPNSWKDLMNPASREHVVLMNISNTYGMQAFLMLNKTLGGTLDDITPGLNAVKTLLGGGATMISATPEIQREFGQNDAWIASFGSDYAFTMRKAGMPISYVSAIEGTAATFITANVVANRPNRDAALQFVDYSISSEAQSCFAEAMRYSPTNSKARVSPEIASELAYGEEAAKRLVRFDPTVVEARRASWVEKWNAAMAK